MRNTWFERAVILLCFAMLGLYPLISASGWRSNSDVHALLEFSSSLVAVTAGVMVLVHFLTTGRWFFLFISIGFVQVGAEEFVHAVFSFDRLWPSALPSVRLGISTTWLTGRAMLVGALFIACLCGDRVVPPEKRSSDALIFNLTGFLLSAIIACAIFNVPQLSGIVRLGTWSKELLELTLAALFFSAFLIYYQRYQQLPNGSPLLLSILCCLAFQVVIHLFVFDAQFFYDAHWDAAHVFKLLGYFFPIFGVWGETIKIHQIARSQYIELTKEMSVRKQSEQALALYRSHLEDLVQERTSALEQSLADLRHAQEQLIQSEKLSALGSVVAGVSHELNTPLGNTRMAISTLIDDILEVKRIYEDKTLKVQQIKFFFQRSEEIALLAQRGVERAIELVGVFKQVAADQIAANRSEFDLSELLQNIITMQRAKTPSLPWNIVLDSNPGIQLDSYPESLEQVVTSLIQNSISHGFEGRQHGCIRIAARLDPQSAPKQRIVLLTVSDDGHGVPPEHIDKLFDPFFTTKLGKGGSGIGLNITHRIVTRLLGGTINVESPPRAGTTFILRIPQQSPVLI